MNTPIEFVQRLIPLSILAQLEILLHAHHVPDIVLVDDAAEELNKELRVLNAILRNSIDDALPQDRDHILGQMCNVESFLEEDVELAVDCLDQPNYLSLFDNHLGVLSIMILHIYVHLVHKFLGFFYCFTISSQNLKIILPLFVLGHVFVLELHQRALDLVDVKREAFLFHYSIKIREFILKGEPLLPAYDEAVQVSVRYHKELVSF